MVEHKEGPPRFEMVRGKPALVGKVTCHNDRLARLQWREDRGFEVNTAGGIWDLADAKRMLDEIDDCLLYAAMLKPASDRHMAAFRALRDGHKASEGKDT
jgi:hypothetical protein